MAGTRARKAGGLKLQTVERVILYVTDIKRSTRFYHETLGIPVREESPGWVELETKGVSVCLHPGRKAKVTKDNATIGFKVDDFDAAYRALQIREVRGLTAPRQPCDTLRCAGFEDPDGNALYIEGK